jgi:hypothetical protein
MLCLVYELGRVFVTCFGIAFFLSGVAALALMVCVL